jgi:hypothetical protein
MKFFDAGSEAVGFIAIGQQATGVIAIGQLATGVIAIGQLARGVVVVGQLAIGVAAFGQLIAALTYGGGMVGLVGIRTRPSLLIWGFAGTGHLRQGGRWRPSFERARSTGGLTALRVASGVLVLGLVVGIGLSWLPDYVDGPPEPPPPSFEPGTR